MKSIFITIALFATIANAGLFESRKLTAGEEKKIISAIKDDKLDDLKALLKDKPSWNEKGAFDGDGGKFILWLSTNPSYWIGKGSKSNESIAENRICRPEIVEYLLSQGIKPTEQFFGSDTIGNGHLTGAIHSACAKTAKLLVEKMEPKDVADATKRLKMDMYSDIADDPIKAPQVIEIAQSLAVYNKSKCESSKEDVFCESHEHLKAQVKSFTEKEERRMHAVSKEGQLESASEEICYEEGEVQRFKRLMVEEKEKAKISGLINPLKLKEWGDAVYVHQKKRDAIAAKYKQLTKKIFNLKSCEN